MGSASSKLATKTATRQLPRSTPSANSTVLKTATISPNAVVNPISGERLDKPIESSGVAEVGQAGDDAGQHAAQSNSQVGNERAPSEKELQDSLSIGNAAQGGVKDVGQAGDDAGAANGINQSATRQFSYGSENKESIGKTGTQKPYASEGKDDAIRRDAFDPDFLANLNKLGPVHVNKAGTHYQANAQALQTLLHRTDTYTSTSSVPPANHLTSDILSSILDKLKTLPSSSSSTNTVSEEAKALFKQYGISEERMNGLRRWVNSPSIDKERTKVLVNEQGEESVKMTAIWV